ncbi:DUF4124 domain-containing protein [Alcanivorax sediminis]|uniref:DUF4124 domain-containing protein n=1 Tax=Alcanivorax sediminis TaxID=2663008 RepID=A0A6N7LWI1_9GAMM|nr:DUF4124 domain-containing protein [Alcanivorax sediminis]MQX54848.1 DUF4124 domain-containing protein [Alcanivorax sediminis]
MKRFSLLLGITLLAFTSSAIAEKFYKWVDENGVTHYGAQPPSNQDASVVNTRANASSSQGDAIEALNERREADAKQKENARKAEAESRKASENPDAASEERCAGHKKNLEILQNKPIVRRENPETGEMEVLDQEQREEMMSEARKALEKCEEM